MVDFNLIKTCGNEDERETEFGSKKLNNLLGYHLCFSPRNGIRPRRPDLMKLTDSLSESNPMDP